MNPHDQSAVSAPADSCANCGKPLVAAIKADAVLGSEDGLMFCSDLCEQSYPKPIGDRRFRPVLVAAAIAFLAATAFLLVCVVYRFRYLH
jgi:hypothetical protein